jgi:hypothetical protein
MIQQTHHKGENDEIDVTTIAPLQADNNVAWVVMLSLCPTWVDYGPSMHQLSRELLLRGIVQHQQLPRVAPGMVKIHPSTRDEIVLLHQGLFWGSDGDMNQAEGAHCPFTYVRVQAESRSSEVPNADGTSTTTAPMPLLDSLVAQIQVCVSVPPKHIGK